MTTPQAAPSPPEQFVLVLAAVFIPPLATFLAQRTIFTKEFLVTVILTFFGHIPGSVFAIYYIFYIDFPSRGVEGYSTIGDNESRVGTAPQQNQGGAHSQGPHSNNQSRGPGHRLGGDEDHTISEQQQGFIHHTGPREGGSQNKHKPYRDDLEGDVENPGAPLLNANDLPAYDDVVDGKHKKTSDGKSVDNKIQR
ncbi:hypothetical protein CANMA_004744 [Candida margitis]|uniref:uncharacterized protein n=1 Tax=Candida margitis TaxID=1775924 RepID=UPI002227BACB|nr:uncharacterized protein CANMA_004744 [Candida margitis]KAI5953905.1 hypothetical protein CANMA_004744 [Candida margitis]